LRQAFARTHVVQTIGMEGSRRMPDVDLSFLANDRERELASQEVRPDQIWLLCLPKSGPNAGLERGIERIDGRQ
jgi:hypothetical protein